MAIKNKSNYYSNQHHRALHCAATFICNRTRDFEYEELMSMGWLEHARYYEEYRGYKAYKWCKAALMKAIERNRDKALYNAWSFRPSSKDRFLSAHNREDTWGFIPEAPDDLTKAMVDIEFADYCIELLRDIPTLYRSFNMLFKNGLNQKEAAREEGICPAAMSARVSKGVDKIRFRLEQKGEQYG